MKYRPIDLHRAGAIFIFIPKCGKCSKPVPQCQCGRPGRRPS